MWLQGRHRLSGCLKRAVQSSGRLIHRSSLALILVLPLGIYRDNPDSTWATLSAHYGGGQYASILRGCEGNVINKVGNDYDDFAVSGHLAVPPRTNSPLVLGLAYGQWKSGAYRTPYSETLSAPMSISFSYYNPTLSLEARKIGMGFGILTGSRPQDLSPAPEDNMTDASFHFRVGDPKKFYAIVSLNENKPLVSGGGYYDFGIGWASTKNAHFYIGVSGGLYDSFGLLTQGQLPVSKHLYLCGAFRYWDVHGISEQGISGGLEGRF